MPDPLRKQLADQVWTILEGWDALTTADSLKLLRLGNRIDKSHGGWLKKSVQSLPADFSSLEIDFDRITHSGWGALEGFSGEDPNAASGTCPFVVRQTAHIVITVRHALPAVSGSNAVADEVVNALFAAGPRLGLPSLVVRLQDDWESEERDATEDEKPYPGRIISITQTIETQQDGRALLAALEA